MNPMNEVKIEKATISIGVGEQVKVIPCYYSLEEMFNQIPVKLTLK